VNAHRDPVVVVMGPAGSGKSTLGFALAERMAWPFVEGDTLHPPANVAAMRAGIPLTDEDRWPWLERVATQIRSWSASGSGGVITCSALKRSYRERLAGDAGHTVFVFPSAPPDVLAARLAARTGHYMPPSLLTSQLAALEEPLAEEHVIAVNGTRPVADTVDRLVQILADRFGVTTGRRG
jgi:gluconokinase